MYVFKKSNKVKHTLYMPYLPSLNVFDTDQPFFSLRLTYFFAFSMGTYYCSAPLHAGGFLITRVPACICNLVIGNPFCTTKISVFAPVLKISRFSVPLHTLSSSRLQFQKCKA